MIVDKSSLDYKVLLRLEYMNVYDAFFYLDQVERFYAVEKFVKGEKDVLVATDVASKGLDFPDIQHVINYDLPEDIENYGKIFDWIKFFFFMYEF